MPKFYVYLHRYATGPKRGEIFYVGKGCGNRARIGTTRTQHWKNIVSKYGCEIEIAVSNLTEDHAFELEALITETIGLDGLANMCLGGGGTAGRPMTADNLAKLIDARRSYVPTEDSRAKMRKSNTMNADDLKARGLDRTGTKWTDAAREKLLNPELRAKIGRAQRKPVTCSNGMLFSHAESAADWLRNNGSTRAAKSNISLVCLGQRKSAYGFVWAFASK